MRTLHHHRPRLDGDTLLVTRQAAVFFGVGVSVERLRRACQPIACDVASRAVLYDLAELERRFPQRVA